MSDEMHRRNTRDVVPELREQAQRLRTMFPLKSDKEGWLLRDEIAANTIEEQRRVIKRLLSVIGPTKAEGML